MLRNMATNGIARGRSARLASRYLQSNPEDDTREFFFKLITYFKRYTKMSASTDLTKCIRNSLRHFSQHLRREDFAGMYVEAVFALFEIFRATNSDVIQNSLEELFLHVLKRCVMLSINLERPSLLRRSPKSDIHYQVVPGCVKKFTIDSFFYQPFNLTSLWGATKTLLRYGLRFDMEENDVYHFLQEKLLYLSERKVLTEFTQEEADEMVALVKEQYKTYGDQRRLYFVLMAVFMLFFREEGQRYQTYTKNLKLFFKSIPDPLITITETEGFFKIILKGKTEKIRMADYCNIFLIDLPRSAEPLQPRSLKHLCRCAVRECLTKSVKLPHGVWSLHIPKTLRNYILIQETENEFHNRYVKYLKPR